jgi:hypothetical protein
MGLYTWSLELLIPYSDGVNLLGDKVTRCCIHFSFLWAVFLCSIWGLELGLGLGLVLQVTWTSRHIKHIVLKFFIYLIYHDFAKIYGSAEI